MASYNDRKRDFLHWLLDNYEHANPSVTYLLNVLLSNDDILKSVVFSEAAKYAPRGIYISYQDNSAVPFVYYKDQLSYTMSEQAFHDLRLNQRYDNHTFYLEFNIPHLYDMLYRYDVFEENPYLPERDNQSAILEDLLYDVSYKAKLRQVRIDLDQALETHDFEMAEYCLRLIELIQGETDAD